MTPRRTCLAGIAFLIPASALEVANVDMTFAVDGDYLRTGSYDWPDSPEQGEITGADFGFSDGTERTWKLNEGATIILRQQGNEAGGRLFPGSGGDGIVTFTSDAGTPGRISARGSTYAAMRIGDGPHSGTVNIEGGVTFETGWIFGEGSGNRTLNITTGEFAVYSDNPDKRLNDIDVTLGPDGSLWIQDASASVTDAASFESFAPGATLTPTEGTLVFTNNVIRTAILGHSPVGTRIEVETVNDPELQLAGPWHFAGGLVPRTVEIPFSNSGPSETLALDALQPVTLDGPDSAFFSVGPFDAELAPGEAGSVHLSFDPTLPGGGARSYSASLVLHSNDPVQASIATSIQVTTYPAEPGLVSHFTFDESATPGMDLGPLGNHGTLVGDAAFTTDSIVGSGALDLDGDGDLVELGPGSGADYTSSLVDDGDGFTFACWADLPAAAPTGFTRFFSTYMPSGFTATGWSAGFASNSRLLGTTYGLVDYYTDNGTTPGRDAWHHYAYVFRGDPVGRIDYYIDGAWVDTVTTASTGLTPAPSQTFAIGCLGIPGAAHHTMGKLDDLRIYDRELSDSEIAGMIPPDRDPAIRTENRIDLGNRPAEIPTHFQLAIHNDGATQALLLSAATWSGPDADRFTTLTDLSSPLSISPGDSIALEFSFDPAGEGRAFEASLDLASSDPGRPLTRLPVTAFAIPPPTKAAILFVHAHADDESIFGGGLLPYYTRVRDLPVAVLTMVTRNPNGSSPITSGGTSRIDELRRAMDVYAGQTLGSGTDLGAEYLTGNIRQVNGGFIDTGCCSVPPDDTWSEAGDGYGWGLSSGATQLTPGVGNLEGNPDARAAAALVVAREIRRFRPEVVVTCHDLEGDYGHSNHTCTAIAVIDAYELAADPATDIGGLPPWQAKKLYLRGGPGDNRDTIAYTFSDPLFPGSFTSDGAITPLFHDHFELPSIGGVSPRTVADNGLNQHVSQGSPDVSTVFVGTQNFNGHHSEWWTLYRSEPGPDRIRPDFSILGDTTATTYSDWARGDFLDHLLVFPDSDEDGLPDAWELAHFSGEQATRPDIDADGDGNRNLEEFVFGLDPNTRDRVALSFTEDRSHLEFSLPAASGDGYEFLERRWQLIHSPDLIDWSTIVAEGVADGTLIRHRIGSAGESARTGFYRARVFLE